MSGECDRFVDECISLQVRPSGKLTALTKTNEVSMCSEHQVIETLPYLVDLHGRILRIRGEGSDMGIRTLSCRQASIAQHRRQHLVHLVPGV